MKAWEHARDLLRHARPVVLTEEEQTWEEGATFGERDDAAIKLFWGSNVPGSGAPESCAIAALGAMENKGFLLPAYDDILSQGLAARAADDMPALHVAHLRLWQCLNAARPDPDHPAQQSRRFASWEDFDAAVTWPEAQSVALDESFTDKTAAGWRGQLIGAAVGTALEGYTAAQLAQKFGPITDYVRKPNTFNDDITYELCLLEAFGAKGPAVTSQDIAELWVALVPSGWSAEQIALDHLHRGVLPPQSGLLANPFDEWIGAQMRGAICGMLAPGNAREAARLAWLDGQISHSSNGILGEVFNAVLCARAYVETDLRKLAVDTIALMPADSEYGRVCRLALQACETADDWQQAWAVCDAALEQYHWIHAFPNAAAQIVALWFGRDSFDQMQQIICEIGHDADCNAAQILCAYGIAHGQSAIAPRWTAPLGEVIVTYMRRPKQITFDALVAQTVDAVKRWA